MRYISVKLNIDLWAWNLWKTRSRKHYCWTTTTIECGPFEFEVHWS